jgi:flagellin-like hook-associated protein FlgL
MTISGVGGRTSYIGSGILDLRSQLDTLTQQLSSGKVSNTYAGQGSGRSLAITLRSQISGIAGYADTAVNLNTRIGVANLSLQRLVDIGSSVKGAAVSAGTTLDNTGQTAGQKTASLGFFDSVDMLNARSGDRYLFSGRATDTAPVTAANVIMDGDGVKDGLKKVIANRAEADLGTAKMGRLTIATPALTPSVVTIAEDASPSAFGMKLTHVDSTLTGSTVSGPTGTPAAISVDLGTTNPNPGDKVKFTFTLPDNTTETIEMTAVAPGTTPLPDNSFEIVVGTPPTDTSGTAANLNAALTTSVSALAKGPMVAASAIAAGDNFFDSPPMRVGPGGAAATTLVDGSATTVSWYNGEANDTSLNGSARGSAVAQIDQSITVQYGARADEQALRAQLQTVAVFAAFSIDVTNLATDPAVAKNAGAQVTALNQRVAQNLATVPGTQSIQDIQADFAGASVSIKSTTDRQVQTKAISETLLDSIEGINDDEVATKILALQTALQASYQTTSTLYQMSLVKFL